MKQLTVIRGSDLDLLAGTANTEWRLAVRAGEESVQHAIACGRVLAEAKSKMAKGEWLPWLAANFEGTRRTATRYMQLASTFGTRVSQNDSPNDSAETSGLQELPQSQRKALAAIIAGSSAAANSAPSDKDSEDYDGDEWYTPPEYIEAARKLMGGIDLDPASNPEAQKIVKASAYLTAEDDALADRHTWGGKIWLNPPYSATLIKAFVAKLIQQHETGNIEQAVLLVNNCTDTVWFHSLLNRYPVCFTEGRVQFWRPNQTSFATRQGQAIFYAGRKRKSFAASFSAFGAVMEKMG